MNSSIRGAVLAVLASLSLLPQAHADLVIEAEDFNHGSGQTVASASVMPYYGGAYAGLGATHDVDYHQVVDDGSSPEYRLGESPNVPMTPNADMDRGGWTVTTNYRIGWTEAGDWYNYTRTFPAGNYQVLAALSYDGTAPGQLKGSMQRVTAGATTTSQTLQQLGIFDAPGSGGWGLNNLVPLKDGSGNDVLVNLSGSATVRFTAESGDIDYYVFRLIAAPQINQEPSDVAVVEGGTASFTVVVSNPAGCTYQWYRGASLINGATASTYTLSPALAGDSGATFRCRITNPQGVVDSRTAVLTVSSDATAPTLVSVTSLGDLNTVSLVFSEPVDPVSATTPGNYTLNQGASVSSVSFAGDTQTVVLKTSTLSPALTYTLTVNNVKDRAAIPNTIAAGTQRNFSLAFTPLDVAAIRGANETAGPSSRNTALVITEIHYNPPLRADGRELEFIEIYNSEDAPAKLGGFRLSGEIDFTFPPNTTLAARSYLVVAPVPADITAVYGVTGVLGGFTNRLGNNGGTLRLRNPANAVLLEVNYDNRDPWPVAADNAGHTLVLARPSYGENDPRAWAASDVVGGTPGSAESPGANPLRTVFINEILAHTDLPQEDYVELFNYSASPVDLSGAILTDDPATNRFVIPAGTALPARGALSFTQSQLGFALDAAGETVYLLNPSRTRVVDTVRFGAQENGVAFGRSPDGATRWTRLTSPTPGSNNTAPRAASVVINEIHFNPPAGDEDEFIELYNRSGSAVNLGGWRLRDAVDYTFPSNYVLGANSYVVVARNAPRVLTNHPGLNSALVLGNYQGTLDNGGEQLTLTMPDTVIRTNNGVVITNLIHIAVDEVNYVDAGRWSRWADGGGSSLELIDPDSDRNNPANWADSDETGKSSWVTVQHTGVLDNGNGAINEFQALLLGAGEALLDNVEVSSGGGNLVGNATFEGGTGGWVIQGNHVRSGLRSPGQGDASSLALHLRASSGGDNGANRVETDLTTSLNAGSTATLRGRARWLKGHPDLLLRLHGNHLEAVGHLPIPSNLGSPGAANSRRLPNQGPAIFAVTHSPVLPAAGQAVTVRARVDDPDALASLVLRYRLDPTTNLATVPMTYNGAGLFTAVLPGQAAGTLAAFRIEATDAPVTGAATTRFPADPASDCLVRWGEVTPAGALGVYRMWMTKTNIDTWTAREKLSNQAQDGTFVHGNQRVIYNAGARYRGSPFIRPGYNTPTGTRCAYVWTLPDDDPFLGADELNLDSLEPGDRDPTAIREVTSFWMASQLGLPFSHQRYIHVVLNGVSNGARGIPVYTDTQQPDSAYTRSWFADDPRGEIFKIDDWFEFNDAVGMEFNINATLENFTTTGGVKKQARYRWSWEKKFNGTLDDDYTRLFALVDALNAPAADYVDAVQSLIDVDAWITVFALRHAVGDWDGYGYDRGKNQFAYKPEEGPWQMLLWDLDFSLGCNGGHGPTQNLFQVNDPVLSTLYNHPHFRRAYYEALYRIAYGPMEATNSTPFIQAKYNSLLNNSVAGLTSPFVGSGAQGLSIPDWISQRRAYIIGELAAANTTFAITSNGGNSFSTSQNIITLTGTAPLNVHSIRINGISHPILWTSLTTWTVQLALGPSANTLAVQGYDFAGTSVAGASDTIAITYTGVADSPEGSLVINEIQYNPAVPDAAYVEIRNRSTTTAFNLTDYRLNGVDFVFPPGTIIAPGEYLVIAANAAGFVASYGTAIPIASVFQGGLDNGGETLQLLRPGSTPGSELLVDEVTYDDDLPWPALADGFGPSLQLIDSAQDNNRVANWGATTGTTGSGTQTLVAMTASWRYNQGAVDLGTAWRNPGYNDAAWPSGPALLYREDAALPAPKNTPLTNSITTVYFRTGFTFSGNPAAVTLRLSGIIDDGVVVYLNGTEIYRAGMNAGTVGFADYANRTVGDAVQEGPVVVSANALVAGANVLAAELHPVNGTSSDAVFGLLLEAEATGLKPYTPGAPNSLAAALPTLPPLWLNEVQILNATGPTDNAGQRDPWIEIHNAGTTSADLTGWYLTDTFTNLTKWPLPPATTLPAGGFRLVWADGEPAQTSGTNLHTSFRLSPTNTAIALTRISGATTTVVDYIVAPAPNTDRSYGAYPDATPTRRRSFYYATPYAPNNPNWPPAPATVNEWMAANATTIVDPVDGDYDDWFELYNEGPTALDLSGFTLTDNPANPTQWTLPAGTTIPAGGFLLIWADGETNQNAISGLHAPFSLSRNGDTIALYAPNGSLVNSVTFGLQDTDVTEGRWPDANSSVYVLAQPTPAGPNLLSNASNRPPVLATIGSRSGNEGTPLTFTASATDPDAGQSLTYSLDAAPPGAVINAASGLFSWTPSESQGPGVFQATVRVTDNGSPTQSDTETITLTIAEVNTAPALPPLTGRAVNEGSLLSFSVTATDADLPAQSLTYSLDPSAPAGAAIHPASGLFTWTPSEGQGPGSYSITIVATDNGSPALNSSQTFTVAVAELNSTPTLAPVPPQTTDEQAAWQLQLAGADVDLPANSLTYSVVNGPAGLTVNPTSGLVSWAPTEAQGPSTNQVTVRVVDNGSPNLAATQSFTLTVREINTAPTLAPISDQNLNELAAFQLQLAATDNDTPTNALTYSVLNGPPGLSVDPVSGLLTWTPTEAQGPSTDTVTVRVLDNGSPSLAGTRSFTLTVAELNTAPVLSPIGDQSVDAGTLLSFTVSATDSDLPAQTLSFSMDAGAPAGATFTPASRTFTWTPAAAQAPSTNSVTFRVVEVASNPLGDHETILIVVRSTATTPPRFTSIQTVAPGQYRLTWSSVAGKSYRVESKANLALPAWTAGPTVTATGTSTETTVSSSDPYRFYRVVQTN